MGKKKEKVKHVGVGVTGLKLSRGRDQTVTGKGGDEAVYITDMSGCSEDEVEGRGKLHVD